LFLASGGHALQLSLNPNFLSRLQESAHLKAVLDNPQFQLDPFAAIHQHLLATQPPAAAKKDDKKDDTAGKQGKVFKDKKSRRKKGTSSISQAMDI
jgi:hypothetical protein